MNPGGGPRADPYPYPIGPRRVAFDCCARRIEGIAVVAPVLA